MYSNYALKGSNPEPSDPKPVRYIAVREMSRDFGISYSTFCSTEEERWEKVSRKIFIRFDGNTVTVWTSVLF